MCVISDENAYIRSEKYTVSNVDYCRGRSIYSKQIVYLCMIYILNASCNRSSICCACCPTANCSSSYAGNMANSCIVWIWSGPRAQTAACATELASAHATSGRALCCGSSGGGASGGGGGRTASTSIAVAVVDERERRDSLTIIRTWWSAGY